MCDSLGPTSLGLSKLPRLLGSLFPLIDWGSLFHYFFKLVFNFLLFLFSWHPCDSNVGMFKVVPEAPKPLHIFWILVSSFCSGWMFISSFWSKLLIWVPVSFSSLLVPCMFFFYIYIYWLCYYSCPISAPSLNSILPTPSLPHSPPIVHVHGSYI